MIPVSIPCWVFWASRLQRYRIALEGVVFQSRAGFSGRLDVDSAMASRRLNKFQSRAGFSGRLDKSSTDREPTANRFQSRAGFSGRLDLADSHAFRQVVQVSIPCWVFWASRLGGQRRSGLAGPGFNPVLGFLGVSTGDESTADTLEDMFQSRAGFSGRLDYSAFETRGKTHQKFQSRAGFSGRLDQVREAVSVDDGMFQSRAGFSGRLDLACEVRPELVEQFQSRAGFSGRLDIARWTNHERETRFNPVLGFLGVSTMPGEQSTLDEL